VGLEASDIGRASMPSSVNNRRKVNWVAPNVKACGLSASIARLVGVSCREEMTGTVKPFGASIVRRPPIWSRDAVTTSHPSLRITHCTFH
jgi:hypothetical protein